MDNIELLEALESLAAACPWDEVDIWVTRRPECQYKFTAYIRENEKLCFRSVFGSGATPMEAVQQCLSSAGTRDPELARKQKIAELQQQIAKLQGVVIGLPPYRPNRELAAVNPIKVPQTVDVEGTITT